MVGRGLSKKLRAAGYNRIKTAPFKYAGPGRIAISGGTRRMARGFKHYPRMAPTRELFAADLEGDDWRARFEREVLRRLDAQRVYDELLALAAGAEPVLLCYETPGEPCHRRIVAAWFERELHLKVPEMAIRRQFINSK